ncbi:hypothetical protein [Pseudomonas fluorescens]|uniref:Uncharacterized protein n=1 Tax=Pseudomonas fluorescens TaxID=294 RepID=A0A5E7JXR4_PSEFL|nr:hypothetical protein [Pseudomonas fluorescens]VVO93160.1 hypothetical protein PS880_02418 [Pseudomonas fluorescens]
MFQLNVFKQFGQITLELRSALPLLLSNFRIENEIDECYWHSLSVLQYPGHQRCYAINPSVIHTSSLTGENVVSWNFKRQMIDILNRTSLITSADRTV